jgi:uncharacterized protein with HEPN domain
LPSSLRRQHLQDILDHINGIEEFVAGMTLEQYVTDRKTKAAVERYILTVAEAAFRLGTNADELIPKHDWHGLRGMGNILRHAYDKLEDEVIWETITVDLPELKQSVLLVIDDPRLAR